MANSLNRFISNVKQGISRTNRYTVEFALPNTLTMPQDSLRKALLFCDQVQLPGMNYSTIQNRTFGEFRETPYEKLFDTVNMSFYMDKDFIVKSLFDEWMNSIQSPSTRKFEYYKNYTTDMTIDVQDTSDLTRYRLKMVECYPKTLGSVQLDYASKDVMKLSITMQYKYWRATPTTQSKTDGDVVHTTANVESYIPPFTPQGIDAGVIPSELNLPRLPRIGTFNF